MMAASFADPSTNNALKLEPGSSSAAYGAAMDDPFVSNSEEGIASRESHRFSSFDTQLFSLNASSPAQAKRALEAHLAETERRLQDASRLGTALVHQQKELSDKLKEVERQQNEGEIGLDLRHKLMDLEKEYNEIGRESARAFLAPKRLVSGAEEGGLGTPSFDQKSPASPALLSTQVTSSPSKVGVPSRKQRNQASSRVHDIEFATEISTSLLAQVRQLQSLLAEREETLKEVNLEKSRLELEAEGFSQRIRALDESEQRYKDENWSLETQTHELMAAIKEAADRENRLNGSLGAMAEEKSAVQRELEELKQVNGKLVEDQAAAQKTHDAELHLLRRNLNTGDAERFTLQSKVEELTSQNQELAKAVAMRLRQQEFEATRIFTPIHEAELHDQTTPENSPPVSPNKPTPRHNHLESETLKSSLGHAHRMIQNLKSNIHREKTEKIELKRMLQEARDELEQRRREAQAPQPAAKRHKSKQEAFKKPPRPEMLGAGKRRTEIEIDEPDWEDHVSEASPTRAAVSRKPSRSPDGRSTEPSSAYQTATEAEDAFETADERETTTESEAFQTGIESMAEDSTGELTETEDRSGSQQGTLRRRVPSALTLAKAGDRTSFQSTASTSADEDEEVYTPVQTQPQRYRLKMNRGALRRIRPSGEAPMASESEPSSVRNSPATSFSQDSAAPMGQSLFAELGELGTPGSEGDFDIPTRSRTASLASTPRIPDYRRPSEADVPPLPRPVMVDSGMMTEPWEASFVTNDKTVNDEAATSTVPMTPQKAELPKLVNSATQWTPLRASPGLNGEHLITVPTPPKTIWDESAPDLQREEEEPEPTAAETLQLDVSPIFSEEIAPVAPTVPDLNISSVLAQATEPMAPKLPEPERVERETQTPLLPELIVSPLYTEQTEPMSPQSPEISVQSVAQLSFSTIHSAETIPVEPVRASIVPGAFAITDEDDSTERPRTAVQAKDAERKAPVLIAEDDTSEDAHDDMTIQKGTGLPLGTISGNVAPRETKQRAKSTKADHGAQTILSSKQIDQILMDREAVRPLSSQIDQARDFSSPATTPKARPPASVQGSVPFLQPVPKRPGSAGSQRSTATSHPPLPADHRQAIAAAQKVSSEIPQSSPGTMGPPLAPASAYRTNAAAGPRPPNEQALQTGNAKFATTRAGNRRDSQISRRSSVSSFASELNERFNIGADTMPTPQGYGPGTDPRMIQAITQTMIGEFLWKYTRKTVSGEMSSTRHRRYFWVHPYTRTLYWSDQDPQTAGKSELKAKSVAIEAVRVITDDNPYPPGLHRKSLEVITPGRRVKFTAATSQRHETWFNALSYLLLRSSDEGSEDHDNITSEDIDEFNPGFRTTSRQTTSRMSFSSYNSRTARNTVKPRAGSAMSMRPAATPGRASPALSAPHSSTVRGPEQARSSSRLSAVINTTIRSSFSSLRGRHSQAEGSVYDPTVADRDSAEELRQVIERQEREADRLENVRACCDGKHDVSSLSRTSRYSPRVNRHSHSHH